MPFPRNVHLAHAHAAAVKGRGGRGRGRGYVYFFCLSCVFCVCVSNNETHMQRPYVRSEIDVHKTHIHDYVRTLRQTKRRQITHVRTVTDVDNKKKKKKNVPTEIDVHKNTYVRTKGRRQNMRAHYRSRCTQQIHTRTETCVNKTRTYRSRR